MAGDETLSDGPTAKDRYKPSIWKKHREEGLNLSAPYVPLPPSPMLGCKLSPQEALPSLFTEEERVGPPCLKELRVRG